MTTLKELNGKVWYRFLKVIYILFYLPYFVLLFIVIHESRDLHQQILPDTVQEVLKDPEFYKLNDYEMRNVLEIVVSKSNLPWENFINVDGTIQEIKKQPVPTTPLQKKYIYEPYHTLNILNSIKYGFIVLICYILVMEGIRRGFYYIVIGKVFPKE